jgi:uncharacterized protein
MIIPVGIIIYYIMDTLTFVDVNAQNKYEETAFMWACKTGHLEIVKVLVEAGADVNAQDNRGETALMRASKKGCLKVVKFLVEAGADVNAQDKYGETALMRASYMGHLDVVKVLVEAGADVNAQDNRGFTALMEATRDLDAVKFLIKAGADVNAQDDRGFTALIWATRVGNGEAVKFLALKKPIFLSKIACPDFVCPICRDTSGNTTTLTCSHAFHTECITEWYYITPSCPMCRTLID